MELAILWMLLSVAAAIWAGKLSRSGWGWFFFSLFLSPLLAAVFLLVLGSAARCPKYKEGVNKAATVCKHCGSEIESAA